MHKTLTPSTLHSRQTEGEGAAETDGQMDDAGRAEQQPYPSRGRASSRSSGVVILML